MCRRSCQIRLINMVFCRAAALVFLLAGTAIARPLESEPVGAVACTQTSEYRQLNWKDKTVLNEPRRIHWLIQLNSVGGGKQIMHATPPRGDSFESCLHGGRSSQSRQSRLQHRSRSPRRRSPLKSQRQSSCLQLPIPERSARSTSVHSRRWRRRRSIANGAKAPGRRSGPMLQQSGGTKSTRSGCDEGRLPLCRRGRTCASCVTGVMTRVGSRRAKSPAAMPRMAGRQCRLASLDGQSQRPKWK